LISISAHRSVSAAHWKYCVIRVFQKGYEIVAQPGAYVGIISALSLNIFEKCFSNKFLNQVLIHQHEGD
jgi:hypothetical protein